MSQNKTIQVRKIELIKVSWKELQTYEFNNLKQSENRDISKLKNSIVNTKFSDPFDVWGRYVIDGAGRRLALLELEKEGYNIPDLPCQMIEAENLKEAKKLVLQRNGQNGIITQASLGDFTSSDFEIEELKDLQINELNLRELDFMIESLEVEELPDYSDKNKEIDPENLGNESSLVFKLSHQTYLQVLDLLNNAKGKLQVDTNEEVLLSLLSDYE